jgi:hypothetical protein
MVILLYATNGVAQSSSKRRSASPSTGTITDIRQVDFLNFTYHSSLCSQEFGKKGIGKTVRVRKGEYKNTNVYFTVGENKVVYGDVTGDGQEDAIVPISCGAATANFSLSEIYIYTIKNGHATLLAGISDKDMERDYRHYYPDTESYWGVTGNDLSVKDGNLEIEVFVDGPHASPQSIATLEYRLNGQSFQLIGKPERRNSSQ